MANGERLARIETILARLEQRRPCEDCQNVGSIIKMKHNLRIINWVGTILSSAALIEAARRLFHLIVDHGGGTPPL